MRKYLCLTCQGVLPAGRMASVLLFLVFFSVSAKAQIITTIAGNGVAGYTGDGAAATAAQLDVPTCVITDPQGNVYINNQFKTCIRRVDTLGIITTIAGTGTLGYNSDSIAATAAELDESWGIAMDAAGSTYIADETNRRVRKVAGGIMTTIAGNGVYASTGDGGAAASAELQSPVGIATDATGNVYVGDQDAHCVRKISPAGIITKFAGSGGLGNSGDGGPALSAEFGYIWGLGTDAAGNVYICDGLYNCVRKVNSAGIIKTIAGNGTAGFTSDNVAATATTLNEPTSVFVSSAGEIYITDFLNNRVRKINTSGIITTIAGTGVAGFSGDNSLATAAKLYHPLSVTMDANDNIYISDLDNIRIRKISKGLAFTGGHRQYMTLCENSADVSLDSQLTIIDKNIGRGDTCILVSGPSHGSVVVSYTTTATGSAFIPFGVSYSPAVGYYGGDSIKVCITDGGVTDTTTIYITIDELFLNAGTITGASSVCAGSQITLTDSAAGGVWSASNANAAINPAPDGCTVSGISTGADTIIYTVSNVCGTVSSKKTITINNLPDAGVITGPGAVCLGSSITLTDTATDGAWSSSNATASVTSGIVTGLASGTDTVLYTVTNTHCKAAAIYTVRVDTFPDAGVIIGPASLCVGSQITLNDTVSGGAWSGSDTIAIVHDTLVTGVAKGMETISYNITNACGTATATISVTIGDLPAIPAVTEYEGVFYAPPGFSGYQWTLNSTAISGATADSCVVSTAGKYAVTVTNTYGCSASSLPQAFAGCGADALKVYPNPSESMVYVQWCKKVTIKLLCADGRLVKKVSNTDKIDLGDLPNGMYFLAMYDENGIYVKTRRVTKVTE